MFLLLFVRYKKGQIFSLCKKKKKKIQKGQGFMRALSVWLKATTFSCFLLQVDKLIVKSLNWHILMFSPFNKDY